MKEMQEEMCNLIQKREKNNERDAGEMREFDSEKNEKYAGRVRKLLFDSE